MNNCFFGLLRNYLRVDNVICKIIDTRIFHKFGENYILREHMIKEGTYDQLRNKGFTFTSDCSLSPQQSDLVSKFLDNSFTIKDKIIFN
jgi:type 2A phosphatase activator TIP41